MMQKSVARQRKKELTITRVLDAPPDLVWEAWTNPTFIVRWWGPRGFTTPVARIDLRVGGRSLYSIRSPDGQEIWSTGIFREIVPGKKIVTTDNFSDEKGTVVPASYYGMAGDWPDELLVTVTFKRLGNRTRLTLIHEGLPHGEMAEGARSGWNESFDKLEKLLEEERSRTERNVLVIEPGRPASLTRIFEARPERIFRAMTDPLQIPLWWGPRNLTTRVDRMEAKTGGSWRFVQQDAAGTEYAFHGVYHEVAPHRIVQTFEFEGAPGHVQLEVITLEPVDGKTRMVDKSVIETPEDLEEMLKSGMAEGWKETMDRLAELVEAETG